jgi:hypothetical protein
MLIRIALIASGLILTCLTQTIEVFGQEGTTAATMTGCLIRSGSPGFYLLREERTGLSTTVWVGRSGEVLGWQQGQIDRKVGS